MSIEQITGPEGEEHAQYLHHDQQGSTRLITGEKGETLGTYTYGPYGTIEHHEGTATTRLAYDGQLTSSETGLIYLRTRTYDPATAQFLSIDPLNAVTQQPYSYALDNPVNLVDPSGLIFGIPGTPSTGEIVGGVVEGVEATARQVERNYGQIAEASAVAICLSGVGTIPCAVATGTGFIASTVQNAASPGGFSGASEALDIVGTLPGAQVTGADLAGFLGDESVGRTAAELAAAIFGGSAIVGESPIAEAEAMAIVCE